MSDPQLPEEGEVVGEGAVQAPSPEVDGPETDEVAELRRLADERTVDLQRLQAEYVNYKKRVDRDRAQARESGVESVLRDLMPVLDAITLAKQHEEVDGGFKMLVDEIEKLTTRHGLLAFGVVGEEFDPVRHEALMEVALDEPVPVVTVSQVIQQGYELNGRVIRPARVAVANP